MAQARAPSSNDLRRKFPEQVVGIFVVPSTRAADRARIDNLVGLTETYERLPVDPMLFYYDPYDDRLDNVHPAP